MFSNRTRWDRTANRLSLLLERKRGEGRAVLDLTLSNPTQAGIPYPPDLLGLLADPGGLAYEPHPRGLLAAREAICADYRRRGGGLEPGRLVLTASTSEAYAFLFKLLCDAGDEVLAPRPSYPLFDYLAGLESVAVRPYPLSYEDGWRLEAEAVAEACTPRTRAVVVVNPNNPTGTFLKRDEASALHAVAAERGLALVSDEVFADYAWAPDPRRVETLAGDGPALAFSLGGMSKSCGLPQLKLAWIAVSGPQGLRTEALARLEIVADTYLSVGTPVQRALSALLARRAERQAPLAARVTSNLRALEGRLEAGSPASLLSAEGGWSAVLRIPATLPEEEQVLALLERSDVLVHPGFFFDFPQESFLVISLLPAPEVFTEGVDRILGML